MMAPLRKEKTEKLDKDVAYRTLYLINIEMMLEADGANIEL